MEQVLEPPSNETTRRRFFCQFEGCHKSYSTKFSLDRHSIEVHSGNKPFVCDYEGCTSSFSTKQRLERHHKGVHLIPKPYKCTDCSMAFAKRNQWQRHVAGHQNLLPYPCPIDGCDVRCLYPSRLKNHLWSSHEVGRPKMYSCRIDGCTQDFVVLKSLQKHEKEFHPSPFMCRDCGKILKTSSGLAIHRKTHDITLSYHCQQCSKAFATKANLRNHVRIIHEGFRFQCDLCEKNFSSNQKLRQHKNATHLKKDPSNEEPSRKKPRFSALEELGVLRKELSPQQ